MIRFRFFGIPVEIQPFFWLTAALLGGGLHASSRERILDVGLFMLAALVSILVHEFGHALAGRRFGGGSPRITLWAMGGLASFDGSRFTRTGNLWTILAGPGAGFAFAGVICGTLYLTLPALHAELLVRFGLFGDPSFLKIPELVESFRERPQLLLLLRHFLWINFWWGVMNLMPVWPLDGGQAAGTFLPRRKTLVLGITVGTAIALFGLLRSEMYLGILFAFLAWQNWNELKRGW
jgi:stage IV sporulation protein FB